MTDVYLFKYSFIFLFIYLNLCIFIYLYVTLPVSYIPRFFRLPLKHLFSYYYTIFKLILFQYDISLSNNFCRVVNGQCG